MPNLIINYYDLPLSDLRPSDFPLYFISLYTGQLLCQRFQEVSLCRLPLAYRVVVAKRTPLRVDPSLTYLIISTPAKSYTYVTHYI